VSKIAKGSVQVQIDPQPLYDHGLVERVIAYLQTRDPHLFPFTARFDEERQKAFVRDLRMGLSDITDSGSKRGTSASGFITSDELLREIVQDWAAAGGGWPMGADPSNPYGVGGVAPFSK
jgi:hypothetical protein